MENKVRKKPNFFSIISLFTMDGLMLHLVCLSIAMLMGEINNKILGISSRIISVLFLVHMVMGIVKLSKLEGKHIKYLKYNYKTLIQRITATLMIVLLVLHILLVKTLENINNYNIVIRILVFLGEFIFFIDCLVHMAISSPKARLSLGSLDSEEKLIKAQKIEMIKNSILGLFAITSLAIYVFGGLL